MLSDDLLINWFSHRDFQTTRYSRTHVKHLRFLPLAFVADVHGFVFFTAYLVVVLTAWSVNRVREGL